MLKFYRKNIKLIIWLIVFSFVAWGVSSISMSTDRDSSYVGSVRGKKISQKEFLTMFRYYDLMTQAQLALARSSRNGGKVGSSAPEPLSIDQLRGLTWQAIVLSREAAREGVKTSDPEVRREIEKLFSTNGQFNKPFYETWVKKNFRSSTRDFEEAIRKHLTAGKIQERVLNGVPQDERVKRWIEWLRGEFNRVDFVDYVLEKQQKEKTK